MEWVDWISILEKKYLDSYTSHNSRIANLNVPKNSKAFKGKVKK